MRGLARAEPQILELTIAFKKFHKPSRKFSRCFQFQPAAPCCACAIKTLTGLGRCQRQQVLPQRRIFDAVLSRIVYIKTERELVRFVEQYHRTRMVCYGINPRCRIQRNRAGYLRSSLDTEIQLSTNLLMDIDIVAKPIKQAHLSALHTWLNKADDYFRDLGLQPPTRAYSGRGFHALLAYAAINTRRHPDIGERLTSENPHSLEAHRTATVTPSRNSSLSRDEACQLIRAQSSRSTDRGQNANRGCDFSYRRWPASCLSCGVRRTKDDQHWRSSLVRLLRREEQFAAWDRIWREFQRDLAKHSTHGEFRLAEKSGHFTRAINLSWSFKRFET